MKIDKNTTQKIARLCKLRVDKDEIEELSLQLSSILDWVEQLNEVDTDKIEPLTNISSSKLPKRKDEAKDINSSDEILKNSPDKIEGYFAVPKVVE